MTGETLLIRIAVGLVAGWLATTVIGGGLGLIGDIVLGIIGAFLGTILFRELSIAVPFGGIAGAITVAFVGAASLLLVLRALRRARWA